MLKKIKGILNSYTDEELDEIDLWVNSSKEVRAIIVDDYSIDLITEDTSVEVNGLKTKEAKS